MLPQFNSNNKNLKYFYNYNFILLFKQFIRNITNISRFP